MKYRWILFDADETLFHFDAYQGLKNLFADYGVDFTQADYQEYEEVNRPLWQDYQAHRIDAQTLQVSRFSQWAERLNADAAELNLGFLNAMADICTPLPCARELLSALKPHAELGIITNGFTALQQARLERTGLADTFSWLVISEQVGHAKPHPAVFDHAFTLMGDPPREQILMVGDTLGSDILGGQNAGIDTCWLNRRGEAPHYGINPTYEVDSLCALQTLLLPEKMPA